MSSIIFLSFSTLVVFHFCFFSTLVFFHFGRFLLSYRSLCLMVYVRCSCRETHVPSCVRQAPLARRTLADNAWKLTTIDGRNTRDSSVRLDGGLLMALWFHQDRDGWSKCPPARESVMMESHQLSKTIYLSITDRAAMRCVDLDRLGLAYEWNSFVKMLSTFTVPSSSIFCSSSHSIQLLHFASLILPSRPLPSP